MMATVFSPFFGGQMLHLVMNGPGSKKLTLLAFNQDMLLSGTLHSVVVNAGGKERVLKIHKKNVATCWNVSSCRL